METYLYPLHEACWIAIASLVNPGEAFCNALQNSRLICLIIEKPLPKGKGSTP